MLTLMTGASRNEPHYATISKVTNGYLMLLGFSAVIWTFLSTEWATVNGIDLLLEFLLPVWLTIAAIPYLYLIVLFAVHEETFTRMRIYSSARHKHLGHNRKLFAIVLRAGLSIRAARTIGKYAGIIVEADGFRSAWHEAERCIRENQRRINSDKVAQLRLTANTGLVGTYQDGKQLDQREHAETKEALSWVATCQMGHYRNLHRYRNDEVFAAIIQSTAEDHGLPVPTDIQLRVSADGRRWYAERKTIAGHWFAIGAAGPPTDQWFYDGPRKPADFPNASEWDQWISGAHSVNWDG